MSYNKVNKLRMYKKIVELTQRYYDADVTTYKGVWRKYVYPIYPISYSQYMKIMGMGNLESQLREEEESNGRAEEERTEQLKLF